MDNYRTEKADGDISRQYHSLEEKHLALDVAFALSLSFKEVPERRAGLFPEYGADGKPTKELRRVWRRHKFSTRGG